MHNLLSLQRIVRTWWPLAASWMLMGAELPVISAVIARLANPEVNLAAYGGVVFPLALIIESPVIMLLAASTALSKDYASYRKVRRFMLVTGGSFTVLHALIAFTPLYYFVVKGLIDAPAEIIEPARIGMMIMTPWTISIAYRRFNQGVLIRFDHSRAVGMGTVVRLSADGLVLALGYQLGSLPGIVVGTSAVAAGVVSEALFVGAVVRPVVHRQVRPARPVAEPLTLRSFLDFYIPLAMTSLLMLLANPIGSAALSRMPQALASLAVWPVVTGLVFMLRGIGIAFNEVVVALLDEPNSVRSLRRFSLLLSLATSGALLLLAGTPLSRFWFEDISALSPGLASLAIAGLWVTLPLPALNVWQSWYQGSILYSKRTRGITESVVIYLLTSALILIGGVVWGKTTGLYIGLAALVLSVFTQTSWLWYRSRPAVRQVERRDEGFSGELVMEGVTSKE
jgi:hypothetical protein